MFNVAKYILSIFRNYVPLIRYFQWWASLRDVVTALQICRYFLRLEQKLVT
jgi:hypothetical protein